MRPFLQYLQENLPPESQWILFTGLDYHKEVQIYNAILTLEEDVLRKILKSKGASDPTYIFMMQIKDMLYQAAEAISVIEHLKSKYQAEYEKSQFYIDRAAKLEQMLTRFETLADIPDTTHLQSIMTQLRTAARERRHHSVTQTQNMTPNK